MNPRQKEKEVSIPDRNKLNPFGFLRTTRVLRRDRGTPILAIGTSESFVPELTPSRPSGGRFRLLRELMTPNAQCDYKRKVVRMSNCDSPCREEKIERACDTFGN